MSRGSNGVIPAQYEKYILALFFAALFASVSWITPATYIAVTPPSENVQINSVSINETSNTTHNVTVNYWSRDEYPIEVAITLYEDNNGSDVTAEKWTVSTVLPAGEGSDVLTLELQDQPDSGLYYYGFEVYIHAGYNIEKTYSYETDTFSITNQTANESEMRPPESPIVSNQMEYDTPNGAL